MAQRKATTPSIYHSLLPAGTLPLLPIPLPTPSTSRRADNPEADMPPWKRLLLTAPIPRVEVGESSVAAARQPGSTMAHRVDHSFVDTMDTRRLAYEQESIKTRQALARSEAYNKALEARIRVLETQAYRHEWQRQDANDRAIEHIIRTQALEAGTRIDTLEYTGHYKRDCPELKNQNHGNQARSMEARGVVHAFGGGETKQDLNNIEDEIKA
ncbi:hypothetical protein Tco_0910469 [Tanacetum coccineum]|uniref:Uncharacterized protein n=1 Tax=Tanacetum coccineum TaxID=301880 RepID=A0ABQ5CZ97_9ASTR